MALEHAALATREDGPNIMEGAGLGIGNGEPAQVLTDGGALVPLLDHASPALSGLGSELVKGVRRRRRAS